jgi:hypothetical protein
MEALLAKQDAEQIEREALATVGHRDLKPGKKRRPSGPERAYEAHLRALRADGEVVTYLAEPEPIEIAHACTYQTDYEVVFRVNDGHVVEWHEVKGGFRRKSKMTGKRGRVVPFFADDGARVKVKVAARLLAARGVPLVVVFQDPRTKAWLREVVKP